MAGAPETTTGAERRLLDAGVLLIALGAIALAVSLFIDWYGVGFGNGISAWTAFELVDIVLAGLAIAALLAVGERILFPAAIPRLPTWASLVCGPIALAIVVVSIVDEPPAAGGAAATLEAGGWIAFAGAGLMTIGALLSTVRISILVGPREQPAPVDRAAETQPLRSPAEAADPDRPAGAR